MSRLSLDADALEVGLDPGRLARVGAHFRKYVDDGRLAGWLVLVSRAGKVAYLETYGRRDEPGAAVEIDTLFRIYSMTKPVTAVAAMMCFEEGLFMLNDPVSRFIPSFGDVRVWTGGTLAAPQTAPPVGPVRVWHLLTHTAGLTYNFSGGNPAVTALFDEAEARVPAGTGLAGWCDAWASVPLLFQPGSSWNYSVASDVLGRVIEVVSGETLDAFFTKRIFEPLQMKETSFQVDEADIGRLAAISVVDPETSKAAFVDKTAFYGVGKPDYFAGGGGLLSTAGDYLRFAEMMRRRGQLDGARLLAPRTVDLMTKNHLPGNADRASFGVPLLPDNPELDVGQGYGLGVGVTVDPVAAKTLASAGTYDWAGAANTYFTVDPAEQLVFIFLAQVVPFAVYPISTELSQLIYQAVVEPPS
jgi:CubicO group peptidase (beta-lactamase class C family)